MNLQIINNQYFVKLLFGINNSSFMISFALKSKRFYIT
jgi:hypothetical protein